LKEAGFSQTADGRVLIADGDYGQVQHDVVMEAQKALTELELYTSTIDGDFGPATLQALLDKTDQVLEDFDAMVDQAADDIEYGHIGETDFDDLPFDEEIGEDETSEEEEGDTTP
jgi:hypothetical protein